jgi:hypothetical protein
MVRPFIPVPAPSGPQHIAHRDRAAQSPERDLALSGHFGDALGRGGNARRDQDLAILGFRAQPRAPAIGTRRSRRSTTAAAKVPNVVIVAVVRR